MAKVRTKFVCFGWVALQMIASKLRAEEMKEEDNVFLMRVFLLNVCDKIFWMNMG